MRILLTICRFFIVAAITYFFACASEEKFILFNTIITEEFRKEFVNNLYWVVFSLLLVYGLLELALLLSNKHDQKVLTNFCKLIFDAHIKKNAALNNAEFRVSFLELKRGIVVRRGEKLYNVGFWEQYLQPVARYQVKQPVEKSKVTFLAGEGCAGACYKQNRTILLHIPIFTIATEALYYQECSNTLNLPPYKAKSLREKAATYICFPVHKYNSTDIVGVISIDCIKDGMSHIFNENKLKKIEEVVEVFSVNFK
jgi:hypothetical protein